MNSVARDEEELLKLEKEFKWAVVSNEAAAVGGLLAGDWTTVVQLDALSTDRVFSK